VADESEKTSDWSPPRKKNETNLQARHSRNAIVSVFDCVGEVLTDSPLMMAGNGFTTLKNRELFVKNINNTRFFLTQK
jgi:hypothetical protein